MNVNSFLMGKITLLNDYIKTTEYNLAKYNYVLTQFPDARVHFGENRQVSFSSKLVNKNYTSFICQQVSYSLYVKPYYELEFSYNGTEEIIKIQSVPRVNTLAFRTIKNRVPTIIFTRFSFNMKNRDFKDDMFNTCRSEIVKYITKYPGHTLDTKNLEPRLKKLLLFM